MTFRYSFRYMHLIVFVILISVFNSAKLLQNVRFQKCHIFDANLTLSCIMLKMAKHTLKILHCEHRKILKVCLTIFQHCIHERLN